VPGRDDYELLLDALSNALADSAVQLRKQFPGLYARVDAILADPERAGQGGWATVPDEPPAWLRKEMERHPRPGRQRPLRDVG